MERHPIDTMKQKTIDLLLDCYIKERIPNADDILEESTNDFPLPKGRSHTFSFAPTPPQCNFQDFEAGAQLVPQGLEKFNLLMSGDVIDGIDRREEQKCREVARKLAKMADEFQEHYMNVSPNKSVLSFSEEHENVYTTEERSTVERIYAGGASQNVSGIASALMSCFTPQTLQAAIQYLSGQSDDVSQQLAITLELSTHVVKAMGRSVLSTIRNVVTETFQHRAELEDL